jgi:hypothetical protein
LIDTGEMRNKISSELRNKWAVLENMH